MSRSASPSRAKPTSAPRSTTGGLQRGGIGGAAADVDVHAVGRHVDGLDAWPRWRPGWSARGPRPSRSPRPGRCAGRRPRSPSPGRSGAPDSARPRGPASMRRPIAALPTPASSPVAPDERLELLLDVVVELEAVAVEDLEAVVIGRVVRGRDHDPGGVRAGPGEVGEGRRGHHAHDVDIDAEAGRTGGQGGHEHVPRAARVLAHDQRAAGADQPMGGGPTQGVGQGRLEVDVGHPADAVGAEQAGHVSRRSGTASGPAPSADGDGLTRDADAHADDGRIGPDQGHPAGQAHGRPRPRACPRPGRPTSTLATRRRAVDAIEVGGRAAEGQQHPVGAQLVGQPGLVAGQRRSPVSKLRVEVTGRTVTLTSTVVAPQGDHARGQDQRGREHARAGQAGHADRLGLDAGQGLQLIGVAFDRDRRRIDRDRGDLEAGRRVAADERADRQGPRLAVGEDRDGHPGRGRLDLDGRDRRAELVHGQEPDILVDVQPGRLDDHIAPGGHDRVDDGGRARDGDGGGLDRRLADLQADRHGARPR